LDYAHSRGFIHGDIKPENILFASDAGRPFLSDFGSARRAAFVEQVHTQSGELAGPGTTSYLSPEQIDDTSTTASSDIYAFGTVAYEMLTAKLPVEVRQSVYRQMSAKMSGDLIQARVANPRLPRHAADALMKALSVDAAIRPATALLVCQMLAGEASVESQSKGFSNRMSRRRLTRAQRLALLTAIITAVGAIIVAAVNAIPSFFGRGVAHQESTKGK
jgi:serine/threonine protein kinase